jgi:hypothetical protein
LLLQQGSHALVQVQVQEAREGQSLDQRERQEQGIMGTVQMATESMVTALAKATTCEAGPQLYTESEAGAYGRLIALLKTQQGLISFFFCVRTSSW